MRRYSAPGAIRRCHVPPLQFREPVPTYRRRACAARPPGNRRAPSCTSRVVTRKLARRRPPASPGADRPPTCFMLPPAELASTGIDLDAVPVPRIEEIFRRGTFTRPMPGQAAVLGQRGRQVLRPTAATPSAVPCPPGHMPPSAFIAGTSPRRSPRSARCGPVTPTGRDLRHTGGYRTMAAASGRHAARLLFQSRRILLAESEQFTMVSATLLAAGRSSGSGRCRPARRPV